MMHPILNHCALDLNNLTYNYHRVIERRLACRAKLPLIHGPTKIDYAIDYALSSAKRETNKQKMFSLMHFPRFRFLKDYAYLKPSKKRVSKRRYYVNTFKERSKFYRL